MMGKVLEVFVPDLPLQNMIGFKIETDNEIMTLILEQNNKNVHILKNDYVLITKKMIGNKELLDIDYVGDRDE